LLASCGGGWVAKPPQFKLVGLKRVPTRFLLYICKPGDWLYIQWLTIGGKNHPPSYFKNHPFQCVNCIYIYNGYLNLKIEGWWGRKGGGVGFKKPKTWPLCLPLFFIAIYPYKSMIYNLSGELLLSTIYYGYISAYHMGWGLSG
jgi:hypothetical protein